MEKIFHKQSKGRLAYGLGLAAWLVYALISFFAPRGGNTFHINPVNFILLQFTIVIPILLIWMMAIYGAVNFRSYASLIKGSGDGAALNSITSGLYLLTASFIIQTLLSVLKRLAANTPIMNVTVLMHNHVPVVLSLVAVIYIFMGSRMLVSFVGAKIHQFDLLLGLVVFGLATAWLAPYMYSHISHNLVNGVPNFIVPGHWPFYTIAVPYMFAWLLSILTIVNIITYTRVVKGAIYRAGLKYAAAGIMVVVTLAVGLQIITFLANALQKMSLNSLLGLIYLLLIGYAVGFWLVAVGARKLARIEVAQ